MPLVSENGNWTAKLVAVRLSEPEAVAFAESVMVEAELLMDWIVVPAGMPVASHVFPDRIARSCS